MNAATIQRLETELKSEYHGAIAATDGNRRLIKLPVVEFPPGCRPQSSAALVVLDPGADKPEIYLAEIPSLSSGVRPATGQIPIAGETWNTYSYALQNWNADTGTAVQFVQGKLRRFSLV